MVLQGFDKSEAAQCHPARYRRTAQGGTLFGQGFVDLPADLGRFRRELHVVTLAGQAELFINIVDFAAVGIEDFAQQRAQHQVFAGVFQVLFAVGQLGLHLRHHGFGFGRAEGAQTLYVFRQYGIMHGQVRDAEGADIAVFHRYGIGRAAVARFGLHQLQGGVLPLDIHFGIGQVDGFEKFQIADLGRRGLNGADGAGQGAQAEFAVVVQNHVSAFLRSYAAGVPV